MTANGGHRRLIYGGPSLYGSGGGVQDPAWSPQGRSIAFDDVVNDVTGRRAVFIEPPNGRGGHEVTPATMSAFEPSFSPDGRNLVFTAYTYETEPDGSTQLYTMPVTGGAPTPITDLDTADSPTWLSNGRIAFESFGRLYTVRADGTDLRRVPLSIGDDSPSWSPHGRNVVFVKRDELEIVRSDGTHMRRLTTGASIDGDPAFSPDGRWIVFSRRTVTPSTVETYPDLWLVDIHGHRLHRVLREPPALLGLHTTGAYEPAWQPLP